jgi:hypothetical protein
MIVILAGVVITAKGINTPSEIAIKIGEFSITTTSVGLGLAALGIFALLYLSSLTLKGVRPHATAQAGPVESFLQRVAAQWRMPLAALLVVLVLITLTSLFWPR